MLSVFLSNGYNISFILLVVLKMFIVIEKNIFILQGDILSVLRLGWIFVLAQAQGERGAF